MMTADGVLSVLSLLRKARTEIWIGGGWGIDALIGEQTRDHRDSALQASPEPSRPFVYPASAFVTGRIGGTTVPCLSADQQVRFHQGYEPADRDRHDMAQLRRVFGITTHF